MDIYVLHTPCDVGKYVELLSLLDAYSGLAKNPHLTVLYFVMVKYFRNINSLRINYILRLNIIT